MNCMNYKDCLNCNRKICNLFTLEDMYIFYESGYFGIEFHNGVPSNLIL